MNRARVLVVEDHPSVLKLIATILESGYEVTTAAAGRAALALVGSARFDAVLTDIRMPDATGFDVLRAVQRVAPRTSVVMMTAYANVPDAVAAIKLGAFDYVAKPLDADELSLVVARAVDHVREVEDAVARREPTEPGGAEVADATRELSLGFHRAVEEARERASREYLVHLMRQFGGNVTQAARRAAMTRESLHRVLKKYGVRSGEHRDGAQPPGVGGPEPGGGVASAG